MNEPTIPEMLDWLKSQMEFYLPSDKRIMKAIRAILEREKKRVEDKTIGEFKYLGIAIDRRDD